LLGGIPIIGKWENVFNGSATTSGRIEKRRLRLDSGHQIRPRCIPHEVLTVVVDVSTGGEICWAEFRKSGKWENVFNGGASTSGCMDKQRPQVDLTHRIGLRSHHHDSSYCRVDVSRGGGICWAEFQKSESGRMFSVAEPQ